MNKNTLPPHLLILYQVWKGYVLNKTEAPKKSQAFFQNNGINTEAEVNFMNEHAFVPLIYYLITTGNIADAKRKLDEINNIAAKANRLERIIEVQVIYAIIYDQLGNDEQAIQCLVKSMEMAFPEKIVLFFFYYFDDIKDLLQKTFKFLATRNHNIPQEYIDKLKGILAKYKKGGKSKSNTDITKREFETLKLIAKDLTNQEIAEQLFISVQTVKSHVKNILLKLDVDNRHKASQKAKELGLI